LNGIEKRVFLEKNKHFHSSIFLSQERENQMLKEIIANFTNNLEAQIEPLFQNLLSSQDFYSLEKQLQATLQQFYFSPSTSSSTPHFYSCLLSLFKTYCPLTRL
jgi:hypothetical protein